MIKIYHNPRCSKSRNALKYLEDKSLEHEIVLYLNENPYTKESLSEIINKTGISVSDFIRKHEDLYKQEYKGKEFSDEKWIEILVNNPKLIIRPIIEKGDRAVFGNPVENIDKLISVCL